MLNIIINAKPADRRAFDHIVEVFTAGAPPPAATLAAIEPLGFTRHPGLRADRDLRPCHRMPLAQRMGRAAGRGARRDQGPDRRADADDGGYHRARRSGPTRCRATARPSARSPFRGNVGDEGLLPTTPRPRPRPSRAAIFHSGDIAFQHPDGYIKITDRAKDIIISGGENVSSVEVEGALDAPPRRARSAPSWRSPTRNGARCPAPSSS